jgi:capsular exopolysaccharide synthesis family protein
MDERQEQEIRPLEILAVLQRRRLLILVCLAGVLLPVFLYNQVAPRIYQAQTTIIFQEQREAIPTFDFSEAFTRQSYLVNQIEEIKSRTLSEEVVDLLPGEIRAVLLPRTNGLTEEARREALTKAVRGSIAAQPVRNSDVIVIKVQATKPKAAAGVANAVAEVVKRRNVAVKREKASSTRKFIEEQLPKVEGALRKDEEALSAFKAHNQVVSLSDEAKELLVRTTSVATEHAKAQAERRAAEQRLASVRAQMKTQRASVVPSITRTTSAWADTLRKKLVSLEVEYTNLLVKGYGTDHPQMKKLTREIAQTKGQLAGEVLRVAEGETLGDPMSRLADLSKESLGLEIDIQTDSTREASLRTVLDSYDRQMERLPNKELLLLRLTRSQQVNDNIYRLLLERFEEARITEAGQIGNVRVIDTAKEPRSPIKPRKFQNLLLALIVGLTLGGGLAFFTESLDRSIKNPEEAEALLGVPVIGLIPTIGDLNGKFKGMRNEIELISSRLVTHFVPRSPVAEAYRTVRTNLSFSRPDNPPRTILVTSAVPQEGKTTTTANLAITLAQMGGKTLIVDSDLRRPAIRKVFNLEAKEGLTDYLIGKGGLDALIRTTDIPNLYILPAGQIPPNPSEVLGSQRMKELVAELSRRFEMVFFDSPPVVAVTDAAVLSRNTDGVVLVVQAGATDREAVARAKTLLGNVQANLLGLVLNNIRIESTYGSYHYRYYYHYYDSEDGKKRKGRR